MSVEILRRVYYRKPKPGECGAVVPKYPIGYNEMSLSERLVCRTLGRCGKPKGHELDPRDLGHALPGCGCPEWNWYAMRCFCKSDNPYMCADGIHSCY